MLPLQNSPVLFLLNNRTIDIDSKENDCFIEIKCPKLDFCKCTNLVYFENVSPISLNWLSIHRSDSLLAYVINPSYTILSNNIEPDPSEQVLRLLNYDNRQIGYCKIKFQSPVSDLSFSYNCPSYKKNLIALIDRCSNINVFSYNSSDDNNKSNESKYEINLLLDIKANTFEIYETVTLNWCSYVSPKDKENNDHDPGMKLAIASDKSIEVLSVDKLIACNSEFEKLELDQKEHEYSTYFDQSNSSIIKVFLSGDGNAVCSASKDNSIRFFQVESSKLKQTKCRELYAEHCNDKISFFHILDRSKNNQNEFWGFAFIGTESGEILIWNLNQWKSLQRIKIVCGNSNNTSNFKYKADTTSHIITAINGVNVFIIQISFDSLSYLNETPKITKITRFEQYNQILSFVCRRSSDRDLDIFWLTPESLERCTIENSKLIVTKPNLSIVINEDKYNRINSKLIDQIIGLTTELKKNQEKKNREIKLINENFKLNRVKYSNKITKKVKKESNSNCDFFCVFLFLIFFGSIGAVAIIYFFLKYIGSKYK